MTGSLDQFNNDSTAANFLAKTWMKINVTDYQWTHSKRTTEQSMAWPCDIICVLSRYCVIYGDPGRWIRYWWEKANGGCAYQYGIMASFEARLVVISNLTNIGIILILNVFYLLLKTSAIVFWNWEWRRCASWFRSRASPMRRFWVCFIVQIFIVYFVAGIKKLESDWLNSHSVPELSKHWIFWPLRYLGRVISL